ncbi:hypothetical protein MMYC01_206973 [Madurella mycetomatis]|uniref:Uncharacterized protein n=1 Tax=Madurella mycetomatis TaxID=100816 RepID=A0A175W3J7_9PEZI|nr:hypothetical protein MMYC01_206973 [Madurella mycetomatis]
MGDNSDGEARATSGPAQHSKDYFYSERLTALARGTVGIISTVTLAVTIYTWVTWRNELPIKVFILPVLSCAASIFISYAAAISSLLHKYGPGGYWLWVLFFDPIIGGLGIIGFVVATGSDELEHPNQPWKGSADAAAYLILIVGYVRET